MAKYSTEEEHIKHYDSSKYRTPDGYTSDIAIFTIISDYVEPYKPPICNLKLMLIKRAERDAEGEPNIEGGKWALPGGFIAETEKGIEAAKRELEEETGVTGIHIKHFGVYDTPKRDPRGWIISNAHYAIVPEDYLDKRRAADDAAEVELFSIEEIKHLPLAFDHRDIIEDAIQAINRDMLQTTLAKNFLPKTFTLSELQQVLLTVTNDSSIVSDSAFYRKGPNLPFLEEVEGQTTNRTSKKPTQLYRFKEKEEVIASIYRL